MDLETLQHQAADLLAQAHHPEAAIAYQQCIEANPDDISNYWHLGLALLLQGEEFDAQAVWLSVLNEANEDLSADLLNFLLGAAKARSTNLVEAEAIFRQILELDATNETAYRKLGEIYFQQDNLEAAIACCQSLLALNPNDFTTYNNLGVLFDCQDRLDEAIACYQNVLTLDSSNLTAHFNLAQLLDRQNQSEAAIAHYQQVISLNPTDVPAHINLGILLEKNNRIEEAIAHYQTVLTLEPRHVDTHYNLGALLCRQGQLDEAIACYQKLISLEPHSSKAHCFLSFVLSQKGDFETARSHCQKALELSPNDTQPYFFMASVLTDQGDLPQAKEFYQRALELEPDNPEAHWNWALTLLQLGDFLPGFAEYEWRKLLPIAPQSFPQPLWDGSDLNGKTILIHAEQGFGDTIQFTRYAPLVRDRGGSVIVQCPPQLADLVRSISDIQVIPFGEPLPPFDCHIPLMSLPHCFQTTAETVPAQIPYLVPPDRPIQLPAQKSDRLKVGLVWSGNALYKKNLTRSCPLSTFEPLLSLSNIHFYSLQKGFQGIETSPFDRLHPLDDQLHDFADTAAAIAQLDLVITIDTAVAHLSGAIGKPTWLLLSFAPDWRWLFQRAESPWYPQMRLFQQKTPGDWEEVMGRVVEELKGIGTLDFRP